VCDPRRCSVVAGHAGGHTLVEDLGHLAPFLSDCPRKRGRSAERFVQLPVRAIAGRGSGRAGMARGGLSRQRKRRNRVSRRADYLLPIPSTLGNFPSSSTALSGGRVRSELFSSSTASMADFVSSGLTP
jgi:hypothetical protein